MGPRAHYARRVQSLADFLGVQDIENVDAQIAEAPSPPKLSAKAFCKEILSTVQYRESLLRRIIMGELPAAVECMLWDRAHGKTVEKVEVKDKTEQLEDLSPEAVAEKLERVQRMLLLLQHAKQEDSEASEGSVH